MAIFNGITLGGLTVLDPPKADLEPVNFFEMHTGAGRYGWGVFLLEYKDYQSLLVAPSARVQLSMWHNDAAKVSFNVVVAGFTPFKLSVRPAGTLHLSNDVVAVHVFDTRCNDITPFNMQMNLQVNGYPLGTSGTPVFYNASNLSSAAWTWATAFGAYGVNVDVTQASLPTTWNPRNIVMDNIPHGKAVDILAAKVGQIPGFDGTTVYIYDIGKALAANTTTLAKMTGYYVFGGQRGFNTTNRLPQTHAVTFRAFDNTSTVTSPTDANITPNYVVNISTAYSGPFTMPLPVSDYVAVTSGGGTALNATELSTVAGDLSLRVLKRASQTPAEYTYAGIWPVFPDGQIWGVRWQLLPAHLGDDRHSGATTTIRYYDDSPFSAGDGQRLLQLDPPAYGMAGVNVGLNYAGPPSIYAMGGGSSGTNLFLTSYDATNHSYGAVTITGTATGSLLTSGLPAGMSASTTTAVWINSFEQGGVGQMAAVGWSVWCAVMIGATSGGTPIPIYIGGTITPAACSNSSNGSSTNVSSVTYSELSSTPTTVPSYGITYVDSSGNLRYIGPSGTNTVLAGP